MNTGILIQNVVHNTVLVVGNLVRGVVLNPFVMNNGTGDPMESNQPGLSIINTERFTILAQMDPWI